MIGEPRYRAIMRALREEIALGRLPPGARLPSEHELVRRFRVSRMTAHRALRELAAEGLVTRAVGSGSFVAERPLDLSVLAIPDVAAEIATSGRTHRAEPLRLERASAPDPVAAALGLAPGAVAFHSLLLHRADDVPLQLEDRWVNPAYAPAYLEQDFTARTPNAYLTAIGRVVEVEQAIEAVAATAQEAKLLEIAPGEPCLALHRRTFANGLWATTVRVLGPGRRWRLTARFRPPG